MTFAWAWKDQPVTTQRDVYQAVQSVLNQNEANVMIDAAMDKDFFLQTEVQYFIMMEQDPAEQNRLSELFGVEPR